MRYIKKGAGIFCESTKIKYAFIGSHSGNYKINDLCRALEVKENGYYDWNKRKINEKTNMEIVEKIKNIHQSSRMTYGYRRVHAELRENMMGINHKKVASLMRENNIFSKRRIKFKSTTKAAKKAININNILNRNFVTDAPNKVWVSDITYIQTEQGWVYLCIILDLFSRKIVGWECSNRINNELVMHTFLKAYWQRKPQKGLIFHSDRGSQYTSNDFQRLRQVKKRKELWD